MVGVVTATLIAAASQLEGDARTPYEDIAGIMTVCYGHTGPDIVKGKTYTKAECDAILKKDLLHHQQAVYRCTNVPLSLNQFNALTLFTYNVGGNAYCNSSLVKKLNKGDYQGAADGLLKWSYVDKTYVRGLYNRRVFERDMFLAK